MPASTTLTERLTATRAPLRRLYLARALVLVSFASAVVYFLLPHLLTLASVDDVVPMIPRNALLPLSAVLAAFAYSTGILVHMSLSRSTQVTAPGPRLSNRPGAPVLPLIASGVLGGFAHLLLTAALTHFPGLVVASVFVPILVLAATGIFYAMTRSALAAPLEDFRRARDAADLADSYADHEGFSSDLADLIDSHTSSD